MSINGAHGSQQEEPIHRANGTEKADENAESVHDAKKADDHQAAESDLSSSGQVSSQVAELETQLKDKEAKYLYLYAEFDNFKKRTIKERSDLIKFGWEPVARDLLGIADNLERALAHAPENMDAGFRQGLEMVLNEFRSTLEKRGIQLIETTSKPFDPNLHEAITSEVSEQPSGTILKDHLRGYTLHGRLLRPAQVVVSAGPKK